MEPDSEQKAEASFLLRAGNLAAGTFNADVRSRCLHAPEHARASPARMRLPLLQAALPTATDSALHVGMRPTLLLHLFAYGHCAKADGLGNREWGMASGGCKGRGCGGGQRFHIGFT